MSAKKIEEKLAKRRETEEMNVESTKILDLYGQWTDELKKYVSFNEEGYIVIPKNTPDHLISSYKNINAILDIFDDSIDSTFIGSMDERKKAMEKLSNLLSLLISEIKVIKSNFPQPQKRKSPEKLTPLMRKKVVKWMIQFSLKYFTKFNTIFLAVSLLNQVFAKRGMRKDDAHLIACGTLWVASDFEKDISKFTVLSFSEVTRFTREDLDLAKETVLQTPDLEIGNLTCYDFAYKFIKIAFSKYNWDDYRRAGRLFFEEFREASAMQLYHFLLISLLCYNCLDCSPSKTAASAVMIVLKKYAYSQEWNPLMAKYSGFTTKNLDKCSRYILNEYDKDTFVEQILSDRKLAITKKYKKKDHTDCHNFKDYISFDTFTSEDDIIFVYNIDTDKIICYDKELLLQWFGKIEPMALWVEGDAMGYGGHPDLDHLVYPLPDGYLWVTECVVRQIRDGKEELIRIHRTMENMPIGNTRGIMGVSMLHGQNPKDIYECALPD